MLSNSYRKIRNKLNLVELWLISTRVNAAFSSSSFLRRHADEIAIHLRTSFGGTYNKIGTIQRRLAWPLRKDNTQNREAFHIYSFRPLSLVKWFIIENIHLYFIWIKDVISSPRKEFMLDAIFLRFHCVDHGINLGSWSCDLIIKDISEHQWPVRLLHYIFFLLSLSTTIS